MKPFDRRVRVGTKVLIQGHGWRTVTRVHPTRKWIQVEGFIGEFQYGHVLKFTNK